MTTFHAGEIVTLADGGNKFNHHGIAVVRHESGELVTVTGLHGYFGTIGLGVYGTYLADRMTLRGYLPGDIVTVTTPDANASGAELGVEYTVLSSSVPTPRRVYINTAAHGRVYVEYLHVRFVRPASEITGWREYTEADAVVGTRLRLKASGASRLRPSYMTAGSEAVIKGVTSTTASVRFAEATYDDEFYVHARGRTWDLANCFDVAITSGSAAAQPETSPAYEDLPNGTPWQSGDLISFTATATLAGDTLNVGCKVFTETQLVEAGGRVSGPLIDPAFDGLKLTSARVPIEFTDATVKHGRLSFLGDALTISYGELYSEEDAEITGHKRPKSPEPPAFDYTALKQGTLWETGTLNEADYRLWAVRVEGDSERSVVLWRLLAASGAHQYSPISYWRNTVNEIAAFDVLKPVFTSDMRRVRRHH